MEKRDTFLIEMQVTFDAYVKWAVSEVSQYTRYAIEASEGDGISKKEKRKRLGRNPHLEELISVSAIQDGDLANIEKTIKRTGNWMKDYERNYVFNNTSVINRIRKAIEQMDSIYRISFAYPDNAIKRTIQLRLDINAKK